jgi:glycosyltransferase involved in cell wall biosynthesis
MGGRPEEIDRARARAAAIGASARMFFSGTRPPSELPVFLALADVLCSPRVKGENTPFKLYTYLASGKPIVATRIATHTQLLDDSLAFLVEPSAEGVASGLRQALLQTDDARARAERGLALVDREYSAERYQAKVARAYAEIAQGLRERR